MELAVFTTTLLACCLVLVAYLIEAVRYIKKRRFVNVYRDSSMWIPLVTVLIVVVSGFVLLWRAYV